MSAVPLRARRLGELIIAQKETVGLNPGTRPSREHGGSMQAPPSIPTLSEAGIDKKLSSRAEECEKTRECQSRWTQNILCKANDEFTLHKDLYVL